MSSTEPALAAVTPASTAPLAPKPAKQDAEPAKPAVTLAPAPVPQDTPWKAVAPGTPAALKVESVEAQTLRKQGESPARPRESKRSTTGREKWVLFTPAAEDFPPPAAPSTGSAPRAPRTPQNKRPGGPKRRPNPRPRDPNGSSAQTARSHSRNASKVDEDKMEKLALDDRRPRPHNAYSYTRTPAGPGGAHGGPPALAGYPATSGYARQPRGAPGVPPAPYFTPIMAPINGVPVVPVPVGMGAPGVFENTFAALTAQVDYYFSVENLCKDMFLRKNMDDEGFVPISVIAGFNRVRVLAPSADLVAQALLHAPNAEVLGALVRPVENFDRWVLPRGARVSDAQVARYPNPLEAVPLPAASPQSPPASAGASAAAKDVEFRAESATPFVPKN